MAIMETWADYKIQIPDQATGHVRTTCPECSSGRQKATEKCLSVEVGEGLFFCHHCSWAGGLKEIESEEVVEHFKHPKYTPLPEMPKNVIKWFTDRGITTTVLFKNNIGFGDKKDIQFPYYKGGKVVNIKHRANPKKFWQEKGAEKCLYRFDEIEKQTSDTLIITEGEIDALSCQVANFEMVTSIPDGAPSTNAKEFHTKFDFMLSADSIIKKYSKVVLAVDNDEPGKLVEQELARRIGAEKCYRVVYPDGCKDPNEVLIKHGWESLRRVIKDAKPFPVKGLFCASDFKAEVNNLYAAGAKRGLSVGWPRLHEFYSVKLGEFTAVTGIPGSGKSNLLDCIAVNMMSQHDWKFLFYSPENWPVERHIQSLLEKTLLAPFAEHGGNTERMSREDINETIDILGKYMFFVYPEEDYLSVDQILEKAKVYISRHGIKGLVIDPWNEIEHDYDRMTEAQYLSKSLSRIRQFAKRNGVHVWVVAHPRNLTKDKDGEYKPPTMYEISGGAHWRNKADNGICLHRPDYSNDITEIYIQKIRFKESGKVGKAELRYIQDTGTYE